MLSPRLDMIARKPCEHGRYDRHRLEGHLNVGDSAFCEGGVPVRADAMSKMSLRPVTQREAREFVARLHRHNRPPIASVFQVGVEVDGELVGVAMAELPKARMLMDGWTLEVSRTCTDGTPNANSMLYGACARAAKALGYTRLITYTLESEPGISLKAAGWTEDGTVESGKSWLRLGQKGHDYMPSEQQPDLFGEIKMRPYEAKRRWVKTL